MVDDDSDVISATVDADITAVAPDVLDHVNGSYGDSLAFVARILGGTDGAEVEAVAIDALGVDLGAVAGGEMVRVTFVEPVTDAAHLGMHLLGLVAHARTVSGEEGRTSAERDLQQIGSIRTFLTTVAAVEDVHPHLRRITVAGGDLASFEPLGPDTFVYVLLPPPGRTALTIDRDFTWESVESLRPHDQPVGAYYTVRAWRPAAAELDLLFVLHEPAGAASAWAERAQPGDPVALWGPRQTFAPPADVSWYLLVADDTGLPAAAVICETRPAGIEVFVVAEVASADERQELPDDDAMHVTWVHRDGAAPGTVAERCLDAVRALRLPDGPGYVWGGGESRTMTAVRRHVRHQLGLPRDRVALVGYWRAGAAVDEESGEDDD